MASYYDLAEDNLLEITDRLDDDALVNYCQTNRRMAVLCSHKVWLHRIFTKGLTSLLQYAVLYPSLQAFYLNIKRDAVYVVLADKNEGREYNKYFTDVNMFYNYCLVNNININNVALNVANNKYDINRLFRFIKLDDILLLPDLDERQALIIRETEFLDTENTYQIIKFDSHDLRRLHVLSYKYWKPQILDLYSVNTAAIYPRRLRPWRFGFYFILSVNGNLYILLDYSLVNSTVDDFYVVEVSPLQNREDSDIYKGLRTFEGNDEDIYSERLLNYLLTNGTMYKLDDTMSLLSQ